MKALKKWCGPKMGKNVVPRTESKNPMVFKKWIRRINELRCKMMLRILQTRKLEALTYDP